MSKKYVLALTTAALATVMATPAFAGIQAGGNSNLIFTAWDTKGTSDTGDDSSYTRDLGKFINDFASTAASSTILPGAVGAGVTFSFAPDTLFVNPDPLVAGWFESVSSQSNVFWNVAAGDSAGARRVLTTAVDGEVPSISNFNFPQITTAIEAYIGALTPLGTHQTQTDGSNTATAADGPALGSSLSWGNNFAQAAGWNNSGTVGQSLDFFLLDDTSGNSNPVTVAKFAFNPDMVWTLGSNGTLVYAADPIPEPGTYALMGLGLMTVFGIARRRVNKK